MELIHDWRKFQTIYYPRGKPRPQSQPNPLLEAPVYLIVEGDRILSAFSGQEDLVSWVGKSCGEILRQKKHREIFVFDRKQVEKWIFESVQMSNLCEQVDFFRAMAVKATQSTEIYFQKHFLLEVLQGWWAKVLPSSFGVFLHFEEEGRDQVIGVGSATSFFVIIQRGKLTAYHEPDLTTLGFVRRNDPMEVVKYLSEKYLIPVQGVFLTESDWVEWCGLENPWRTIAQALQKNKVRLVPFRWSLATLIATRAFLGV